MSRFLKFFAFAVVVCCATASYAATFEIVDRFGDPVTTDVIAVFDGQKVPLGASPNGTFEIDILPGSTVTFYSADASAGLDKAEIVVDDDGTVVTLPPTYRATCDPATNTNVDPIPSVTPFDLVGAGPSPGINEGCGPAPIDDINDTLWFSVTGSGNQMSADTFGSNFDTMLMVVCEGCGTQTCIDSNDDAGSLQSQVIWDSQPGAEYLIAVQGFFGAVGQGDLEVQDLGPNQGQPVGCIPPGACCLPDSCNITTPDDCAAQGGLFLGEGTECYTAKSEADYISAPGTPIPDLGTISDSIDVTDDLVITDVDVDFITDHTFIGDLTITISSPSSSVTLVTGGFGAGNLCEGENGADVIFNDEGGDDFDDASPPCGVSPVVGNGPGLTGSLTSFEGENALGTWTITVTDENGLDVGSLLQWSLHFNTTLNPNCQGACCTNGPGATSECIETTQDECESDVWPFNGGTFIGGSCDDIDDCLPLFVEFESVSATQTRAGVRLDWTTTTEIDTVGFRVLRENGGREKGRVQVGDLIPALGFGLQGGSYSILDADGTLDSRYFIVDIDNRGKETVHGPFHVDVGGRQETPGARVAR